MSGVRVVARLDVKNNYLVKGIQLEGLRKLGAPSEFAARYYAEGIDEILYMDIVASLYNRNSLGDLVQKTAREVFIPLTVGGGLRTVDNVRDMLAQGADKTAINTAAVRTPGLIAEVAKTFGSQCMVLGIEAKKTPGGNYECYCDNGREHTGLEVVEWARKGAQMGAGEILLTSVDCEGLRRGVDKELLEAVRAVVDIPVIYSGGVGNTQDVCTAVNAGADAVAVAAVLHYNQHSVAEIKTALHEDGREVRR